MTRLTGGWQAVDATLQKFLLDERARCRAEHQSTFEDLSLQLGAFLRRERRSLRGMRHHHVRRFLARWYVQAPRSWREARRFAAGLQVLRRWLLREIGRDAFGLQVRRLARDTVRAARAAELLDAYTGHIDAGKATHVHDNRWKVVARGKNHVGLRALDATAVVAPVSLPPAIVRQLVPGTIVNLRLGCVHGVWHVVEHGACLPADAASWLRQPAERCS